MNSVILSPREFLLYLAQHRDVFPPQKLIEYSGLSRATVYRALHLQVGNLDTIEALAQAVSCLTRTPVHVAIVVGKSG